MSTLLIVFFVLGASLIGFALYKKDYVRASLSLKPLGFFLEAKNNDPTSDTNAQTVVKTAK